MAAKKTTVADILKLAADLLEKPKDASKKDIKRLAAFILDQNKAAIKAPAKPARAKAAKTKPAAAPSEPED
jgi:hypothetical protein